MSKNSPTVATRNGEFVGSRLTGDHVTLWVEGRDDAGPTVSATTLDEDQLRALIRRLNRLLDAMVERKAHFGA